MRWTLSRDTCRPCLLAMQLAGMMGLSGCEHSAPQTPPPIRTAKSASATVKESSDAATSSAGDQSGATRKDYRGASFEVPSSWEEKTPRNPDVIAGEFVVPGTAGPGRLTLSAATGGLSANVNRWKDQFQPEADSPETKESTLSINGQDATLVEAFGTFRDTFGGGDPQRNWALLGVVIPLKSTGGAYFVKLTGPRETLEAVRETFVKFAESATFKE